MSNSILPISKLLNPTLFLMLKSLCNLGFLKSAPINIIFFPDIASIVAKLTEQNVFPSPPFVEVTLIIFFFFSELKYWIFVLRELNDSDNNDLEFS